MPSRTPTTLRSRKSRPIIPRDKQFDRAYFEQTIVVALARQLLGARIESFVDGKLTTGWVSETEAYKAPEDKASHAFGFRRTTRTETMYGRGATAYVYLCYGIHHLFNVVTGPKQTPHAVLIRAVLPDDGLETMVSRRKIQAEKQLTNGPGKWTKAFGITTALDGMDLLDPGSPVRLYPPESYISDEDVLVTPRIGIDYAEEWASRPWRFLWSS